MNAEAFSSPIFVKRASYIVQEIASLADAIDFLNEWPEDRRDLTYETALRACCDAYAGHIPVSAASNAFVGFAKRVAILETQPPPCSGSLRARRAAERCRRRLHKLCDTAQGDIVEIELANPAPPDMNQTALMTISWTPATKFSCEGAAGSFG